LQNLKEYLQSNTFAERFNKLIDDIEHFEIPKTVMDKLVEVLNENEFEIAEHQHKSLVSDAEDYAYEKHKEEKYFKDDNWKKIHLKINILLIQKK